MILKRWAKPCARGLRKIPELSYTGKSSGLESGKESSKADADYHSLRRHQQGAAGLGGERAGAAPRLAGGGSVVLARRRHRARGEVGNAAQSPAAVRGRVRARQSRHRAGSGARQGEGRRSRAGARPARRPGGERRTAGDVRNARHCLHRIRLGVLESGLRQDRGQALCGDCGRDRRRKASRWKISTPRSPNTAS